MSVCMCVCMCVCMYVTKIVTQFSQHWLNRSRPNRSHSIRFRVPYIAIEFYEVSISSSKVMYKNVFSLKSGCWKSYMKSSKNLCCCISLDRYLKDLSNESKTSKIWQPCLELWPLKWYLCTFLVSDLTYLYGNYVRIHHPTHHWIGNLKTYPTCLKEWRSGNPVSSYDHLSDIYVLFWCRVSLICMETMYGS